MNYNVVYDQWNTFTTLIRNDPPAARNAFGTLIEMIFPKLVSRAKKGFLKTGDTSMADDLAQEALIKLYDRIVAAGDPPSVIRDFHPNVLIAILYKTMYRDWIKVQVKNDFIENRDFQSEMEPIHHILDSQTERIEKKMDRKIFFESELLKRMKKANRFCFDLLVRVILKKERYDALVLLPSYNDQFSSPGALKQKKYDCQQKFKKSFLSIYQNQ